MTDNLTPNPFPSGKGDKIRRRERSAMTHPLGLAQNVRGGQVEKFIPTPRLSDEVVQPDC